MGDASHLASAPGFTLADYLAVIEHRVDPSLIDSRSIDRLRRLAGQLPGEVSSFFGFECPVSDDTRTADLLFCSTQVEGHSRILAGLHRQVDLPAALLQMPSWRRVRDFCRDWEDPASSLYRKLFNVWLEFDVGQSAPPHAPSLFFGTTPETHQDIARQAALLHEVLQRLAPDALLDERLGTLERALAAAESHGAHVFQTGVMLARNMPAIRLCLRGMPPEQITPMLATCGWTGDVSRLTDLVSRYRDCCTRMDVDIDVGQRIGDKIGIECSFGRDLQSMSVMRAFLDVLQTDRQLTPAQASALLAWNGAEWQGGSSAAWSEHLLRLAALQGRDVSNIIACWLHHVKLVYQSDKPLAAKAYLAVQADFVSRSAFRASLATTASGPTDAVPDVASGR